MELQTETVKGVFDDFDEKIKQKVKENDFPVEGDKPDPEMWADLIENDEDFKEEFFKVYEDENVREADEFSPAIADNDYLNMELALPRDGEEPAFGRVTKRMKDDNGNPIGRADKNPIMDTRMFEVEFLDGTKSAMAANAIAGTGGAAHCGVAAIERLLRKSIVLIIIGVEVHGVCWL